MPTWTAKPLPWHRTFIKNRKRFNHIRYGRRSGKTSLFGDLTLESASQGHKLAITLPTAKDFEKRWVEFERYFHPVLKEARVSDQVMVFTTKAQMDWYGIYRIDGMRGNKYHRVLNDECAHADGFMYAWEGVIRPTLMDYKGDAYFGSTPNGMNDFHKLETDHAVKSPDEWYCQHGTTYDNPYIDHSEIESLRRTMSSIMFRQEILAEYVDAEGARVKREWLRYGEAPKGLRCYVGVDLAISQREEADYTALVVTMHDSDGTIYVPYAIRRKATFNETLRLIQSVYDQWQPDVVAVEQVGYQAAVVQELIRTTNIPVQGIPVTRDKVTRFFPVEGKLEHGHIVFSRSLDPAFESELLSFPHGEHDDYVDALVHSINAAQNQVSVSWL